MNNAGDWLLNLSIGRLGDFISINVLKKRRFRFGLSLNTSQLLPFLKASFSIAWTECFLSLVLEPGMNSPLGAGLKRAIWALSLPKTHSLIPNEAADWQTTYSFPGTSNSTIYVTVLYQRLESSCIKRAFLRYGILVCYNSKGNIFAEASEAIQRKIPSNSSSREVVLWF